MKRNLCIWGVLCLLFLSIGSSQVFAKKYPASAPWGPSHTITKNAYLDFAKSVKAASNGSIDFEVYTGGSLLPAKETLRGIADNVAVVGEPTGAYTPADVPLNNVINDLCFINDDAMAASFAITELNFFNTDLQNEWAKNKVVYGGHYSTEVYYLVTINEIRNVSDVKGKKIRTAGKTQADFIKFLGGVPVSMPATEIYSGMGRGSLDGTAADLPLLTVGFKLQEVAKSVNLTSLGTQTSGSAWAYNKKFWASLTPGQRRLLFEQMALAMVRMQMDYVNTAVAAVKSAKERNLTILDPDSSMKKALSEFNENLIKNLPKEAMKSRKIADPTALIQQYISLKNRWKNLLSKIDRNDESVLFNLLKKEIYDKVDENTYCVE